MRVISTPGLHGCSVQFSPFFSEKLAVAASQHFAIAGKGALLLYELNGPTNEHRLLRRYTSEKNKRYTVCVEIYTDNLFIFFFR